MTVSLTKTEAGHKLVIDDIEAFVGDDDLAELSAQAFARLCEMNTERMAVKPAKCGCNLGDFKRYPVCKSPFKQDQEEGADPDFCDNTMRWIGNDRVPCGHSKACHSQPQGAKP